MNYLASLYRAFPFRPHCRWHAHTALCRTASFLGIGPDCDPPAPPG